jgi:hypothetical protein
MKGLLHTLFDCRSFPASVANHGSVAVDQHEYSARYFARAVTGKTYQNIVQPQYPLTTISN